MLRASGGRTLRNLPCSLLYTQLGRKTRKVGNQFSHEAWTIHYRMDFSSSQERPALMRFLGGEASELGKISGGTMHCSMQKVTASTFLPGGQPSSGSACSQQTQRPGQGDSRLPVIHAQLAIDMLGMQLDCSRGDHQFARNFSVRKTLIEQVQDLQLALG